MNDIVFGEGERQEIIVEVSQDMELRAPYDIIIGEQLLIEIPEKVVEHISVFV